MHPGGGHYVIPPRLIGREAAAAMALYDEDINGDRARELGLAWESVDDAAVEDRALELAARPAADPELARVAVGNFPKEVVNGAVRWDVAMQFERPPRCGQCVAAEAVECSRRSIPTDGSLDAAAPGAESAARAENAPSWGPAERQLA
jgi:enoyl-CoA hydratase/carnithine racemase